jgi:hypothetical protein
MIIASFATFTAISFFNKDSAQIPDTGSCFSVISFVLIGIAWAAHHDMFRYIRRSAHLARFQTSEYGLPSPTCVYVLPSTLILNLCVFLMRSAVLSLAYSMVSA